MNRRHAIFKRVNNNKISKPIVVDNTISSVLMTPREGHSKKPDVVRDKIVQLCGDLPRIELFARERAEGWDSWGNEI